MSGQIKFFQPFLTTKRSLGAPTASTTTTTTSTTAVTSSQTEYNQSHMTSTNANTKITEFEEQKTVDEWKQLYQKIILKFILPRRCNYEHDDDVDGSGDQDKELLDELYFKTREDFYYAAKFGLIPLSIAEDCVSQTQESLQISANSESTIQGQGIFSNPNTEDSEQQMETQALHLLSPSDARLAVPEFLPLLNQKNVVRKKRNVITGRSIVPFVANLDQSIKSISDISLQVSSLSIGLATVLNVWKVQKCRPKDMSKLRIQDNSNGGAAQFPFPYEWMTNGPLFINYRRVVSFEIMELELCKGNQQAIRNLSRAAFGQKRKRVQIFFYNLYADAITQVIEHAERAMRSAKNESKKECLKDRLVLSLQNIPAECIFPMYTQDYWDKVRGKPLEEEYGLLSDYCICIGDKSNITYLSDNGTKLNFDSNGLEIGILVKGEDGEFENEFVINQMVVDEVELGVRKGILRRENGSIADDYKRVISGRAESIVGEEDDFAGVEFQEQEQQDEEQDQVQVVGNHQNQPIERRFATAGTGNKRKAQHSDKRYTVLSDIEEIYNRNKDGARKKREVDIYATVLNFGAPRQLQRGGWMLSTTIFDDTLELPSTDTSIDTPNPISQVKLVMFANNPDDFPLFFCAGDVLRGHRVLIDEYEGAIQLTAFNWSDIDVCRPSMESVSSYNSYEGDNEPEYPTDYKKDWCFNSRLKPPLNFSRSKQLWRFAQNRMATCPNVHPRYMFTNGDIEEKVKNNVDESESGDLTAIICDVIPYPAESMSSTSPKGLLRIWDGTGIRRSDTLPTGFPVTPEWSTREEPSEETLTAISKIVEEMKDRRYDADQVRVADNDPNEDFEAPKCLCGRVINVVIWEAKQWAFVQKPGTNAYFKAGKSIRIRNATIRSDNALSLHVHANTSITPVPGNTFEVKTLVQSHHLRVQQNDPFNIRSALLPLELPDEISGRDYKMSSNQIADQQTSSEAEAPTLLDCILLPPNLRCKVKFCIVGIRNELEEGSLSQLVIQSKRKDIINFSYQFYFQVRDDDIDLDLLVPNQVAEKIIGVEASAVVVDGDSTVSSTQRRAGYDRLSGLFKDKGVVEAHIISIELDGRKYFVLADEPTAIP